MRKRTASAIATSSWKEAHSGTAAASLSLGTRPGRRRRALAKAACRRTDRRIVRGVLRVGDDPQGASLRRSLERFLHRSLLAHERRQAFSAGGPAAMDDAARADGAETLARGAR